MGMVFEGKVAIVTGAGRGIGREEALLLASEGASVVVNDLGEAAQVVVNEILEAGGTAAANTDDISSWGGAELLINQAVQTYGGLDVVINNAGILRDVAAKRKDPKESLCTPELFSFSSIKFLG